MTTILDVNVTNTIQKGTTFAVYVCSILSSKRNCLFENPLYHALDLINEPYCSLDWKSIIDRLLTPTNGKW